MSGLARYLVAALMLLLVRRRRAPRRSEGLTRPEFHADSRAELAVLGALGLATVAALFFIVVYFRSASTELLGLAIGVGLGALALAAGIASRWLVPQDKEIEPRPELADECAQAEVVDAVREGGAGLTRKRLLFTATGGALGAVGVAAAVPLVSLGPDASARLTESPWRKGRRLVDEQDAPIAAADVGVGSVRTAFPEGADKEQLASPLVVVRIEPHELDLPHARESWAPDGILAFSKICPHAGCAVALFRYPLYRPRSPKPALVCPCHYSTFDVTTGGERIFGPAGRALPQLPLAVDGDGNLVAAGDYSGRVGPSWWEIRR